jgi:endonuclease YncB( thermonuclease family)
LIKRHLTQLLSAVFLLLPSAALADGVITGRAKVIDGDTLWVSRTKIRLCGIDAPERNKPGGPKATMHLKTITKGRDVRCVIVGSGTPCDGRSRRTSYDRIVAQCFVGDTDLAASLVRSGNARDWKRFSGGYYTR